MLQSKKINHFLKVALLLPLLAACGGSAIPTVSSVTAGEITLVASTETDTSVIPTSLSIVFSKGMDTDTVNTSTVTLSSAASETISISVAADSADTTNKTFTVTPVFALPQNSVLTLTIGTGAQDPDGNALEAAVSYPFGLECAEASGTSWDLLEEFDNEENLSGEDSCWEMNSSTEWAFTTDAINGRSAFTIASGSTTSNEEAPSFYKGELSDSILTATVKITDFSGLAADDTEVLFFDLSLINTLYFTCGLRIYNADDDIIGLSIQKALQEGEEATRESTEIALGTNLTSTTGGEPLYLKIRKSGENLSCLYRIGDTGDFTAVGTTSTADLGTAYSAAISMGRPFTASEDFVVTLDSLELTTDE